MIDGVFRPVPKPERKTKNRNKLGKEKVRQQVIERDGDWCFLCGKPGPGLHLHRITYGSQGGKYEKDNCILLCVIHHEMVHSNKRKWMPLLLKWIKEGVPL